MLKLIAILAALPLIAGAQGRRGSFAPRDWWDSPIVDGLDLSDSQRKQIQSTLRDYRNRLVDARAAVDKAEGNLDDIFNDGPVSPGESQRRADEGVDRLANARAELTRVVSQVS